MKSLYDREPGKADRRTHFEDRTWRRNETFSKYYHAKVFLANAVLIDKEEMTDNLIYDIPNADLRDQARMQRFADKAALLKAFECIEWRKRMAPAIENECGAHLI
ncbi:hypothetical protein KM043_017597 [Ampulex compressa]|nr:hypothetical protein KM043_017597 [Ampulex compressa]